MISIAVLPRCWIEDISDGRIDLFEWINNSKELECDGLELYSGFIKSDESSYLKKIRTQIENLDMTMPMMCHSPDFTIPDSDARKKEVEKQIRMIKITAELGGKFCRTLSGQARPEVSIEQGMDWVLKCIESCLPIAERSGIKLVIENHYKDGYWKYREFAQKKEVFLSIINKIDSSHFGVQYDPSNALVAGDDPVDFLDAVLPRVMTMHASDRYLLPGYTLADLEKADGTLGYAEGFVHGVTGKGENDYDAIFSRLVSVGYNSWISIEDGMNGMDEMKASVEFLKKMRDKYQVSG